MTRVARLSEAKDEFLRSKQKGEQSGNYRRNAKRVLEEWLAQLGDEHDVRYTNDLEVTHCRAYARHLKRRTDLPDDHADSLSGASARTYYDYVAAFCAWLVAEEYLDENPARKNRATTELPDDSPRKERQQVWSAADRQRLVQHVNQRADEALDDHGLSAAAIPALRDRALVYLLAFSGLRVGEVLRDSNDDRRRGVRWSDVEPANNTIYVLGKAEQQRVPASLPGRIHAPLERYKRVLQPPSDDWPIFPSRHYPSLSERVRNVLRGRDYSPEEVEERIDASDDWLVLCREVGADPPSMTTTSARRRLKELSQSAGVDAGQHDYLTPHGGRRGVGDALYEDDPVLAQDALRHQSIETTHQAYRDQRASETAEQMDSAFDSLEAPDDRARDGDGDTDGSADSEELAGDESRQQN